MNNKTGKDSPQKKCLIVIHSYHHNNTEKVARAIADVLNAEVTTPDQIDIDALPNYGLLGFGAGIDSGKHYKPLLDLVHRLPDVDGQKTFIFSTSAVQGENKVRKDHAAVRDCLVSKGYDILDEFSCKGFNTNSFLKFFGGMNKGRPNEEDLANAKGFANEILQTINRE